MPPKLPQVDPPADSGGVSGTDRDPVGRIRRFGPPQPVDQNVDLGGLEAGDGQIEVEVKRGEALQLERQQLMVPAGVLGELVVGEDVGANLGLCQVLEPDSRHRLETKQLGRSNSAVAGNDAAFAVDEHRVGEAEAFDAIGDLAKLFAAMDPRVAHAGPQRIDLATIDT